MGIFTKMKDIVASNINAALDKAEDPRKMIDLSLRKLEKASADIRSSIERKTAEKRDAQERIAEEKAALERWTERARKAAACGKDELAREAIREKREIERKIKADEYTVSSLSSIIPSLESTLRKTEEKLEELSAKAEGLKARAESARIKEKAGESMRDWERRIEEMEARLGRWEDSLRSSQTRDRFEDEEIESELERLRKEAGPSASDKDL